MRVEILRFGYSLDANSVYCREVDHENRLFGVYSITYWFLVGNTGTCYIGIIQDYMAINY